MTSSAPALPPQPETISAEARGLIEMMSQMSSAIPASIEEWRQQTSQMQEAMAGLQLQDHDVSIEDSVISGVPVLIFRPAGGVRAPGILVNAHGGGFMLDSGSKTENIPLAALSGMMIVSVLYRMAPEHPFPAAVDDVVSVFRALRVANPAVKIGMFGTSAGAVIMSQAIVRLRMDGDALPAAFGFFSGSADFSRTGDSEQFFPGPGGQTLRQTSAAYVAATADEGPTLSPLFADLSGFPPTLVLSSTRDLLLSQSTIFHRALRRAKVPAELVVFEGLPHAFWAYIPSPETNEAFGIMSEFFRARLDNA